MNQQVSSCVDQKRMTATELSGPRATKELEGRLAWPDASKSAALGVLAILSGISAHLALNAGTRKSSSYLPIHPHWYVLNHKQIGSNSQASLLERA
jgi:hypothetical protein